MTIIGNSTVDSSQTIGVATFSRGTTTITLTPGTSTTATLAADSAVRETGGTLFVRGTNLGNGPVAGSARMTFNTAPTLVGGGGGPGSKMISIIPWAVGNLSSTGTLGSSDTSFLTYDSNGVRPLVVTGSNTVIEYDSALSGLQGTHNVRLTGTADLGGQPAAINSLVLAPGATTVSGLGTLTIASGGLLNLTTSTI